MLVLFTCSCWHIEGPQYGKNGAYSQVRELWIKKVFAPLIGDHCECSNKDKQAQAVPLNQLAFNLPKFPTLPYSPHFTVGKTEAQRTVYAAVPFLAFWTGAGPSLQQPSPTLPG